MKNSKCSRVQSNLLQQNCYLLESSELRVTPFSPVPDKYLSVDSVSDLSGVHIVETVNNYPITPDYVNSFSSCDYHLDPVGSINNSAPCNNLGDITDLQRLSSMDLTSLKQLQTELAARISQAQSRLNVQNADNQSDLKNNENDKEEKNV